jgi:hypothetical protein
MFDTLVLPAGCRIGAIQHNSHEWREGFLWHRKVSCPGYRIVAKSDWGKANPAITNNRVLAETISTPHKHSMYFEDVSFGRLIFKCSTCPNQRYPFEVRIDRWKWNEMTRTLPKVDQTWPS